MFASFRAHATFFAETFFISKTRNQKCCWNFFWNTFFAVNMFSARLQWPYINDRWFSARLIYPIVYELYGHSLQRTNILFSWLCFEVFKDVVSVYFPIEKYAYFSCSQVLSLEIRLFKFGIVSLRATHWRSICYPSAHFLLSIGSYIDGKNSWFSTTTDEFSTADISMINCRIRYNWWPFCKRNRNKTEGKKWKDLLNKCFCKVNLNSFVRMHVFTISRQ